MPSRASRLLLAAALIGGALGLPLPLPAAPVPPRELEPVPISILVDLGSGQVLESRDPARRFLPASMTKVMTEYVAFREIAAGRLRLDRRFVVSQDVQRIWSRRITGMRLRAGTVLSADTLLHGIATISANDAAIAFAEGYAGSVPAFSVLMNREAARLGMHDSTFASPNGWPDGGLTQVSARDLATLAAALIREHPAMYHAYFGVKAMTYDGVTQFNHNPVLGVVAGADGIKTGHTNEAGYTLLASAERDGRRLVMVLGGVPSPQQRAAAARALLEWGFRAWRTRPLFTRGATVGEARVQGGDLRSVPLVTGAPVYATVPRTTSQPVTVRLRYRGPLVAPIAKGAQVAELEIDVLGQAPGHVPLYAGRDIASAGTIDRLRNGLAGLFS